MNNAFYLYTVCIYLYLIAISECSLPALITLTYMGLQYMISFSIKTNMLFQKCNYDTNNDNNNNNTNIITNNNNNNTDTITNIIIHGIRRRRLSAIEDARRVAMENGEINIVRNITAVDYSRIATIKYLESVTKKRLYTKMDRNAIRLHLQKEKKRQLVLN